MPHLSPSPLCLLLAIIALSACRPRHQMEAPSMRSVFEKKSVAGLDHYDLEEIRRGGEIIVATLSGPNSYYDYHGIPMGLQYALAENFASTQGLTVRVEIARDTLALLTMLADGTADLVAFPLTATAVRARHLVATGYHTEKGTWAVRHDAPLLANALKAWYHKGLCHEIAEAEARRSAQSRHVTRRAQAVFLSRERGVISVYDNLFKAAQSVTGWDWRLIAAQCYQESAFDPNARSSVGAQGLMQLMPSTAREMGVEPHEIFLPEQNVDAGARYIARLNHLFADIRQPEERIRFVLASYNGGSFHIRDAMALARKNGRNPHRWDEVAPYVLALQKREYYTDPVVKYGYMIGSETVNYVQRILLRWRDYGGRVAVTGIPQMPSPSAANPAATPPHTDAGRRNRFATGVRVLSPEELQTASR